MSRSPEGLVWCDNKKNFKRAGKTGEERCANTLQLMVPMHGPDFDGAQRNKHWVRIEGGLRPLDFCPSCMKRKR